MGFKVFKECCQNCLFSPDTIVSTERRVEIIQGCSKDQTHFVCHKASMNNEDTCCKGFYDGMGHLINKIRIFERLGAIEFVEQPNSEKLMTHKEMTKKGIGSKQTLF